MGKIRYWASLSLRRDQLKTQIFPRCPLLLIKKAWSSSPHFRPEEGFPKLLHYNHASLSFYSSIGHCWWSAKQVGISTKYYGGEEGTKELHVVRTNADGQFTDKEEGGGYPTLSSGSTDCAWELVIAMN